MGEIKFSSGWQSTLITLREHLRQTNDKGTIYQVLDALLWQLQLQEEARLERFERK